MDAGDLFILDLSAPSKASTRSCDINSDVESMDVEWDGRTSRSVPLTKTDDLDKMLPFKKRRWHVQLAPSDRCPDIRLRSTPESADAARWQVGVGRRIVSAVDVDNFYSMDASQSDGVLDLTVKMAALPGQQRPQAESRPAEARPDYGELPGGGLTVGRPPADGGCILIGRGCQPVYSEQNDREAITSNTCQDANEEEGVVACDEGYFSEPAISEYQCKLAGEPDEDGDLPLHIAVVKEDKQVVHQLIAIMTKINLSLDAMNNLKQTPLHLAIITKNTELVRILLIAGASSNTPDRKGNTCCHLAVKYNTKECLQAVLSHSKHKVDVNAINYEGMTALHYAAKTGNLECMALLIENGAEIDAADGKSGKTALYLAFERNQTAVADFLLSRGADVNIPTYSGCKLKHAANKRGQQLLNSCNIVTSQGRSAKVSKGQQKMTKRHTSPL